MRRALTTHCFARSAFFLRFNNTTPDKRLAVDFTLSSATIGLVELLPMFLGEMESMWKIFALLAALFAALTAIFAKIGIEGIDSNLATGIRTVVILILIWGIVFATVPLAGIKSLTVTNWIFLILSGAAAGLSWLFYFKAIQLGPVSRVAPIDKLSVALTIVLSFIILGETVSWQVIVGGLLIVSGTLCMLWK